ncbi:MAG: indolepyruvate oxidoreductase subunit beta [Treponema sp.]|nr:indolepyruvate oxidoreductase subunit beta [Treponema sp.]
MAKNILICGVGGQGTVLAAKVLSQAAVMKGERVLSAETIGMAQRGGSVVSHVRIGDDVYSPLIPKGQADIIIAFEAAEAVRNIDFLKKGGMVIVNKKVVQPTTASLTGITFSEDEMISFLEKNCKVTAVDTEKACQELGSTKIVNMILLGAACTTGLVDKNQLKDALKELVKPAFYELNVKAVDYWK